jgi:hypothetical protein
MENKILKTYGVASVILTAKMERSFAETSTKRAVIGKASRRFLPPHFEICSYFSGVRSKFEARGASRVIQNLKSDSAQILNKDFR